MSSIQDRKKILEAQIDKTIDITRVLKILWIKWYIIAAFIGASILVAYIQLRYTKPLYEAGLLIKYDDDKGGQMSDLFKYGKLSGRIENQLKTESEIFRSRTLGLKTINYLNYKLAYYQKGQIVTTELYPFTYFKFDPVYIDSADYGRSYIVQFTSQNVFRVKKSEKSPEINFSIKDTIVLGSSIFKVVIDEPRQLRSVLNKEIIIKIVHPYLAAAQLAGNIDVEVEKGTSILKLGYVSDLPAKAADFVNATAKVYIQESVNSRAKAAEQTLVFIEDLLSDLAFQVEKAQNNLTDFQQKNSVVELEAIGRSEFEKLTSFEGQKSILSLRKNILERLSAQLNKDNNETIELVLLDPEDASELPQTLQLFNGLILDRLSMAQKSKSTSPIMIENAKKIAEVKQAIQKAIENAKNKLQDKEQYLAQQIKLAEQKLSTLPQKQQALLNLERTFKVNEKIYGYLMEKKLETRINKSSIIPNASIIDEATVPAVPFSPIPSKTYFIAFIIGLSLGVITIFTLRFIYNRIPDKETIEEISFTPVIGVIKKLEVDEKEENYELYVMRSPKSIFSESIRGIRTNINFILKNQVHKTICVTSTVSGEGKTFCTVNLGASLTLLGYKVIIVGCDLRRPKIHLTFNGLSNDTGLTTYLIGKSSIQDIINKSEFENLDVIPAGPTPPNPSELLQSEEMEKLMQELKASYDFVFLDTAPVGLVSDSIGLMSKSDINLYILRAQYSKRDFALIPDRLGEDNLIPNIYTVLNSYDSSSAVYSSIYKTAYGGYYGGGGYYYYGGYYTSGGYGYTNKYHSKYYNGYYTDENEPKPWYKKLIKKKKRKKNSPY
ncbi:MAG: GumC family protein [Bacteroidota bacterium]